MLWPHSTAEGPPVMESHSVHVCEQQKTPWVRGGDALSALDHSDGLWFPLTWSQVTPSSRLMLPARGYQLQGATFRWVYMNKGLTPLVFNGKEISKIQKVCPIHEIFFFYLKNYGISKTKSSFVPARSFPQLKHGFCVHAKGVLKTLPRKSSHIYFRSFLG